MMRTLKWLSVISSLGMILILIGGALVTKTDSGLGCGNSWPLCHGELIPSEITPELIIELSHRVISAVVGIAVLLLSIISWKKIGHIREVKFLAFLSIFFLVAQGLIGAAAVVWGQSDFVLAAHFGISLISFASVFLLTILIFEIDQKFNTKSLFIKKGHRTEIYALTIYTIAVVYTGALVRHVNANLACLDWPFCNNSNIFSISSFKFEHWVQMGHRFAAGILFIWTIIFLVKVLKHYRHSKVMYYGWMITTLLILLQVIFGALIIFTLLKSMVIALLHALFITCYFGMLSYFILLSHRSARLESTKLVNNSKGDTKIETI